MALVSVWLAPGLGVGRDDEAGMSAVRQSGASEGFCHTRSRERVRALGEVFTAPREVRQMVDLVAGQSGRVDSLVLEPSCGTCNFLDEVLQRKLQTVIAETLESGWNRAAFYHRTLTALGSLYGVDIDASNILESREVMYESFEFVVTSYLDISALPLGVEGAAKSVLDANLVCADFLDPGAAVVTRWLPRGRVMFAREEWFLSEVCFGEADALDRSGQLSLLRPQKVYPAVPYWCL